ncbi:hypothetical protein BS639_17250 [Rouxiella silvae]|uniref:Putative tail fiber protein gp53-like C-terminal domain-containing protein n=1 Tax=Rouxiella silvae TaxID=1646373 RepID=A0ABX3TXV3_9GAMM|nr:hypothetical protein [Rouxiella silvae]ORJ20040.1 hypothetical protein BS639_17250 [Rouxiella silvae]
MAANNFKPFATGSGANITSQADWEALAALATGFSSGKASSAQINKALRQSSFISAAVAQFIANTLNVDVLDDGDQAGFVTDLISALRTDTTKNLLPVFISQTNGYIAMPALLAGVKTTFYIQFGTFTGTTDSTGNNGVYENSNINVVWPVAFPNANLAVITGGSSDVGGVGMQEMAWSLNKGKTGGTFGVQCRAPSSSMTGSYIAIGY